MRLHPARRGLAAAPALALLATACASPPPPAAPRTTTFHPVGDYRHVITELSFPPELGRYRRTEVTAYDPGSMDVSAQYLLQGALSGSATVYHYPASGDGSFPNYADLSQEFESARHGIEHLREGAELLSEFDGDAMVNGFSLPGRQATYRIDVEDGLSEPVISSLHVYVVENWYLKFRFTHPERETAEVSRLERELVGSIRWPVDRARPEPAPACVELANRYEGVARLQDRGLSREEQIATVEQEVGDAGEDRFLLVVLLNAVSVSEAHPERTSFQIRKLVLEDCVEDGEGRVVLGTLWPWLDEGR